MCKGRKTRSRWGGYPSLREFGLTGWPQPQLSSGLRCHQLGPGSGLSFSRGPSSGLFPPCHQPSWETRASQRGAASTRTVQSWPKFKLFLLQVRWGCRGNKKHDNHTWSEASSEKTKQENGHPDWHTDWGINQTLSTWIWATVSQFPIMSGHFGISNSHNKGVKDYS